MILPGADASHDSTPAAPALRSPWAGRSTLPGWWRLQAWRRQAMLAALLQAARAAEPPLQRLDDEALAACARQARHALRAAVLRAGEAATSATVPAWGAAAAAAAELASRSLGQRPAPAQLQAALAMAQGRLVEAGACSGKSLAIALAAVLGAWAGRRCHLVCGNELLAARHAAAFGPLYLRCGVPCAVLPPQAPAEAAPQAYGAQVLLVTARRLLADRLRDPALWPRATPCWALVDDADRVLIDDAVQPHVASEPGHNPLLLEAIACAQGLAEGFRAGEHYHDRRRLLRFTPAGQALLAEVEARLPPFWRAPSRRDELLMQALVVRDRLVRGRHYDVQPGPAGGARIVLGGELPLAQLVPERSLHTGLLQALEAREGLPLSHPPATRGRLSHQELFGGYRLLGGIASSLRGLESELWRIYGAVVLRQPRTAPPLALRHALAATDDEVRARQAAEAVAEAVRQGAAVLVGLRRMESFRLLVPALRAHGLSPAVLGAAAPGPDDGLLRPGEVVLVPEPLLAGLDVRVLPAATPLQLLLPEPLDSARTEALFHARGQRLPAPRRGLRLWSAPAGTPLAAAVARLQSALPARLADPLALVLLRTGLRLQRAGAARQARRQRRQLFLHEQQLVLQLSFAARGEAPVLRGELHAPLP